MSINYHFLMKTTPCSVDEFPLALGRLRLRIRSSLPTIPRSVTPAHGLSRSPGISVDTSMLIKHRLRKVGKNMHLHTCRTPWISETLPVGVNTDCTDDGLNIPCWQ